MDNKATGAGRTIAARFDAAATLAPDAIALRDGEVTVTYGQLARRSNQFARFLQRRGVVPGDRIVLIAGRSAATIVAMLGINRCGGLYVPLDRQEPESRLARMLADSQPALVLTTPERPGSSEWPVVPLGEALAGSAGLPDGPLAPVGDAADPVCVMYTSGSTGQPKGVVVPQRAVLRLVTDQTYAPFGPAETVLHLAPLAFDASTFEIWGALLHGGTLAIVGEDRASLDAVTAAIAAHRVTTAWFTAGLFALLVDHGLDGLQPLRCLITGGDVVSAPHVARAHAALPSCTIVNGYGPTENTTFTCCYRVPRSVSGQEMLPIGTPIAGTAVHILDPELRPVPDGAVGQICCAGAGLACGYLNQPQQTAEAFVHVPLGGRDPERVYLTGDLGRRRPDGAIEFLGRMDGQVKVRGKRVELGEIENALRQDRTVLDAAVTARDAQPGGKSLTAHLVLRPGDGAPAETARAVLRRLGTVLPDYMVPADARVLESLPLGRSGKVDRARLIEPAPPAPAPMRPAARNDGLEDQVAAVWEEIFRRGPLDRNANVFDLGGNSLLLLELHARLRSTVAPALQLLTLFEHTTIRALAAFLAKERRPPDMPARRWGSVPPLPTRGALPSEASK